MAQLSTPAYPLMHLYHCCLGYRCILKFHVSKAWHQSLSFLSFASSGLKKGYENKIYSLIILKKILMDFKNFKEAFQKNAYAMDFILMFFIILWLQNNIHV